MSTIIINGKSMNVSGNNICIQNNKVYVDGKRVTDADIKEPVKLIVEGDVFNVMSDGDVEIIGNVTGYCKTEGSVSCCDVQGNVKAGGSIRCLDVNGSVSACGSVQCGKIGGDVNTGGSVSQW